MRILTWTHPQVVLAVLILFQRHSLFASATQFNIIVPEDVFVEDNNENGNAPSKLSKVVEFQYWLETLQHRSKTETLTMQKFQERTKEALQAAFSNTSSISQDLNITVDRITWRRVDDTCEEDFPKLEGYSCLIVHSEVALGYSLANNTNHTDALDTRFLDEATISYVGQFFDAFNLDNKPFPYIQVQLRSPLRVGTTIQLAFYNVKRRLGEAEETILRKAFFKEYQEALAKYNDPAFNLTDIQVFLNTMMDSPDHQRRKLYVRSNDGPHDHERLLRLDLYVQATCAGLACQEEVFHNMLYSMMKDTQKSFVETLKHKGVFTAFNDYFEDLSHIKILDDAALPTRNDDSNHIDKISAPQQTSDSEMPLWFWIVILILSLLLSGLAFVLVVIGIKKKGLNKVMEELTHAEQKHKDEEGDPKKSTADHPPNIREASKSSSPRKRLSKKVFPLSPARAGDSALVVYPAHLQLHESPTNGSTTSSPSERTQNNSIDDRVVPTSIDSTPTPTLETSAKIV